MFRCTDCHISKIATAFSKQKRKNGTYGTYGRRSTCKTCRVETETRRYVSESPERKQSRRNKFLIKKYGITIDQYNQMFISQNGRCSGCDRHQNELSKSLAVDHDHKTGIVRGLLCANCNLLIGFSYDIPAALRNLAVYLESRQ